MGSEESHFNVSVGSDGQSHRALSTNHSLFEEKGEPRRYRTEGPSAYQPNALPLGQTGLQRSNGSVMGSVTTPFSNGRGTPPFEA